MPATFFKVFFVFFNNCLTTDFPVFVGTYSQFGQGPGMVTTSTIERLLVI